MFSKIYKYDADGDIQRVEVRMGYLKLGAYVSKNDRQIPRDLFVELHERISLCNIYVQQVQLAKYVDVEEEMSLVFHPYVPTGSHARVYNAPAHDLCVCGTDDINTNYPPLILRSHTTYL